MQDEAARRSRISGLEDLLRETATSGSPPVERWNPPYCGDIGLRIRRDGTWTYRQSPIGRVALVKLFARVLRKDADGRTYLVTPVEKVDVSVEDAPFLAVEMEVTGERAGQLITLRTNLDDVVRIDAAHPLRFALDPASGGLKPYVLVRGRLEALFTRALYMDLVGLAIEDGNGVPGVWSGGLRWPLSAD